MASNMVGKSFKVAIGTRESLKKSGKILQQVDCYIDGESGFLYIVPQENDIVQDDNMFLNDLREPFEFSI